MVVGTGWLNQAAAWDLLMAIVVDQPFRESFLERIVGVNWTGTSGAVFVSGDFCCFERYVKIPRFDAEQNWVGLGSLDFTGGGGTFASTYAKVAGKPVFLIGGHGTGPLMSGGLIMRSTDGLNWETVLHGGGIVSGDEITGLVWNPRPSGQEQLAGHGAFFANILGGLNRPVRSIDGITWDYSFTDFASNCTGLLPGVPDGVYGYDEAQDLLIFPGESSVPNIKDIYDMLGIDYSTSQATAFAFPNASFSLLDKIPFGINGFTEVPAAIGDPDQRPVKKKWELTDIICINFCGGIWMAAGGGFLGDPAAPSGERGNTSMTASSIDGGNTWFLSTYGEIGDTTSDFFVETIIGAPVQDFK
jgi:hypothetical protein